VPLASITHADVVGWVAELTASGLSASTVRHAHRVFAMLLGLAVRDGRLSRNPAERVPLPRVRRTDKRFLDHDQVAELADAAGPYRLVVLVLAYCGLRFGELAALRVRRVDLLRRRLEVAESVTEVAGRVVFGTPNASAAVGAAPPLSRGRAGRRAGQQGTGRPRLHLARRWN
jgi:integrase